MDNLDRARARVPHLVKAAVDMIQETIQKLIAGSGKVLVVGLGITGIETALFLQRCGIDCVCIEKTPRDEYLEGSKFRGRIQELEERSIRLEFGIEGESVEKVLDGVTLAVLSPGVSLESAIVGTLRRHKVQIISELELGMVLAGAPAIAVTGSNGKTTTVTLIQHLLEASGRRSLLCGNVGTPILSALSPDDVKSGKAERFHFLVVEASSYQLETCETIRPKVAVLLNLSDNHLERHGSMQRYFEAKARIFANQMSADLAVLNADDTWAQKLKARLNAPIAWFGVAGDAAASEQRAQIFYHSAAQKDEIAVTLNGKVHTFDLSATKLLGIHNRYDAAAALLAVLAVGGEPAVLQQALCTFEPLEHRLEPVGEVEGVLYINDSKSTTVAAAVAALGAITEAHAARSIVLMLGGMAKAGSWEPLMRGIKAAQGRIRGVICFGGDRKILSSHCEAQGIPHSQSKTLAEAVAMARTNAQAGDIVLLSPGCASYDEFTDFEQRGRRFKELLLQRSAV